ncbi:hypothetical protein OIU93_17460 [Paeniglutamicibacter sp. ZC-3]|uniref:DUF308 domain-containing protein n=1 Tax=Paeniglutamicibacter sp. ZC-3 TaxID=2986919 RepID=UPI0021F7CD76|nr:DUF308 domain-containing protein [Paeniglutamicibacter sp. ZC-3]MCV9996071.1 hypothetical protein [Paeniglutamicibacter sp. ZC-3]
MPAVKIPATIAAEVATPVMGRAATAAGFALVSIFWPAANSQVLAYSLAAFMVISAKFLWDYASVPSAPKSVRGLYAGSAVAMILAGLVMAFRPETLVVAIAGAAAWILAGALEIVVFIRHRAEFVPFKDQLVTGFVSLGAGASLLMGLHLDAHGLLGLAGGGAIILAVFVLISAFGLRHAAKEPETGLWS